MSTQQPDDANLQQVAPPVKSFFQKLVERPFETLPQKVARLESDNDRLRALAEMQREQLKVRFGGNKVAADLVMGDAAYLGFLLEELKGSVSEISNRVHGDENVQKDLDAAKAEIATLRNTLKDKELALEGKEKANSKLRAECENLGRQDKLLSGLVELYSVKNAMLVQLGDVELGGKMRAGFEAVGSLIEVVKSNMQQ